jgi:hypothetical protein
MSGTPSGAPMSYGSQSIPGAFGNRPPLLGATIPAIQGGGNAPFDNGGALAVAPRMESASAALESEALNLDSIREAVLQAMETGGSQMLVQALEEGHWSVEDKQVSIQVGMSDSMIEVSYSKAQEKLSNEAASDAAGRTIKVRLVGGATTTAEVKPRLSHAGQSGGRQSNVTRPGGSDSIKTKAADEPVVKRMKEKFGAEIRIVMDRTER